MRVRTKHNHTEYIRVKQILSQLATSVYIDLADLSYWEYRILNLYKQKKLSDTEFIDLNNLISMLENKMGL